MSRAADLAAALKAKRSGNGWTCRCVAHEDATPSLSISEGANGDVLLHCFAGCTFDAIRDALKAQGIWKENGHARGYSVADLAFEKGLPERLLRESGFRDAMWKEQPVVQIDYKGSDKKIIWTRYRNSGGGDGPKFWCQKGASPRLYGLWRYKADEPVILVEGETDALALWDAGFNALGVPGADNWKDEKYAPALIDAPIIFVHVEPDEGGEKFRKSFEASTLKDRVQFFTVAPQAKDPCELHAKLGDKFEPRIKELLYGSKPTDEPPPKQEELESLPVTDFTTIAATAYIAERALVGDWLHIGAWMLVGDKKIGKSFLGLQLLPAVASGGKFLDWQCQYGETLLLGTEDDEPLLHGRLAQLGIANGPAFPPPKGCHVVTGEGLKALAKRFNTEDKPMSLDEWMFRWIHDHPAVRLVIIDTLDIAETVWAGGVISHHGQKITQVDYNQTAAWHSFARKHKLVILLVCHTGKTKGRYIDNPFELQNATNTKAAGAAGQIVLWNPKVNRIDDEGGAKQYVLSMEGRQIPGGDRHFGLHRDSSGRWINDGPWTVVRQTELERELMEALRELCEEPGTPRDALFTTRDIAEASGRKSPNVQRALTRMIEAGRLTYGSYRVIRRPGKGGGFRLDSTKEE